MLFRRTLLWISETDSQHDCPRCGELLQQLRSRIAEFEARVEKLMEVSLRSGKRQEIIDGGDG